MSKTDFAGYYLKVNAYWHT